MDGEASTQPNLKLGSKHSDMLVFLSEDEKDDKNDEETTYLESDLDENDKKTMEQDVNFSIDKRRILRNGAWEYFEVADEEQKLATCTLCRDQFSYRTTSTNLARHLKRRHCIEFEKVTDEDCNAEKDGEGQYIAEKDSDEEYNAEKDSDDGNEGDEDDEGKTTADKRKTSAAWEYFTITDPVKRVATCKICGRRSSYFTSVSNLMKHVRCKHLNGQVKCEDETEALETLEEIEFAFSKAEGKNHNRSSVWLYFKCIDKTAKIAVCLICKKKLSHNTSITNLKKHLYRKHPRVKLDAPVNDKKMLIASDGQLYEIEDTSKRGHASDGQLYEIEDTSKRGHASDDSDNQGRNEPLELDTVYLDEYEPVTPKKRTRSTSYNRSTSLKRSKRDAGDKRTFLNEATVAETISSDDEITLRKRYVRKKDDSLDQFGKYIVSLLKQLPKELSNQLQADFVKQVMTAQLSYETQKEVVAPNNGYAITITKSRANDKLADTQTGPGLGNS